MMTDQPTVCPYCLKHIAFVPLPVHEERCPARQAGVEPHTPHTVAFAAHVQAVLAASRTRGGRT